jgi:hypothetical protein
VNEPAFALRHERHYTVEQANAKRPWVCERVRRVRDSLSGLSTEQARAALEAMEFDEGGGYPGYEVASAVIQLLDALSELEAGEIVLRDADRGLVDFPSIRNGEEVYLCWLVDEPEVAWWHEHHAGFVGRRPIADCG